MYNRNKILKELERNLKTNKQYVYLMENEMGRFKIGISHDVENRRMQLQGSSGLYIKIVAYYKPLYRQASDIEKQLHSLFAKYRTLGEWFQFPDTYSKEKFNTLCERVSMVEMERDNEMKCMPFLIADKFIEGTNITESKRLTEEYYTILATPEPVTEESIEYWRKRYGIKPKRKSHRA